MQLVYVSARVFILVMAPAFFASILITASVAANAQTYPNKPIRIYTAEPGGGGDFASRLIGQALPSSNLGQAWVVENRGGAGGAIAAEVVAKAPPDGYSLLMFSNGFWTLPFLQNVPYDPAKDFTAVSLVAMSPNVLVLSPAVPVKSVQEFIALTKSKSVNLSYGSGGPGTPSHLAAELFKAMAGGEFVHVPYKGVGPAINDLLGGHLQFMFSGASSVSVHIKSGRLKALAVTSAAPSRLFPDLPTMSASGVPGYEWTSLYGVWATAGTPPALVNRLSQSIAQALNKPDVTEKFFISGSEVVGGTPEQFAATIKSETIKVSKIIKSAGIPFNPN